MSNYEIRKLDQEFLLFARNNFEKPGRCKNLEQIRFYVQELTIKIEWLKSQFNYVPKAAYTLLAQYNDLQNQMIFADFRNSY